MIWEAVTLLYVITMYRIDVHVIVELRCFLMFGWRFGMWFIYCFIHMAYRSQTTWLFVQQFVYRLIGLRKHHNSSSLAHYEGKLLVIGESPSEEGIIRCSNVFFIVQSPGFPSNGSIKAINMAEIVFMSSSGTLRVPCQVCSCRERPHVDLYAWAIWGSRIYHAFILSR